VNRYFNLEVVPGRRLELLFKRLLQQRRRKVFAANLPAHCVLLSKEMLSVDEPKELDIADGGGRRRFSDADRSSSYRSPSLGRHVL
jgi:hypothetical protein